MIELISENSVSETNKYLISYDSWEAVNGEHVTLLPRTEFPTLIFEFDQDKITAPAVHIKVARGERPLINHSAKGERIIQFIRTDTLSDEDKFFIKMSGGYNEKIDV